MNIIVVYVVNEYIIFVRVIMVVVRVIINTVRMNLLDV